MLKELDLRLVFRIEYKCQIHLFERYNHRVKKNISDDYIVKFVMI